MSNLYNLEPPPTAKVLLQTTAGEIILELFAKQTPLASRNFIQHCLDGYYDNTIFHRIVPKFIIQGGDPTGTGFGGESVFEDGTHFEDEFHSRLKYTRRGLLGMANSGNRNENASQFFVTLGPTPELAGKNTLFGRVVGDTIFNVIKMSEAEIAMEGGERPLYPDKITSTEILLNPFEDMKKREKVRHSKAKKEKPQEKKKQKQKSKRKVGKSLLSFADDGDDGIEYPSNKKPKFNPNLIISSEISAKDKSSSERAVKETEMEIEAEAEEESGTESVENENSHEIEVRHSISNQNELLPEKKSLSKPYIQTGITKEISMPAPPPPRKTRKEKLEDQKAEFDNLKAALKRTDQPTEIILEKPKTTLEAMIPPTSTRGRKRGSAYSTDAKEEARTMDLFKSFKTKLESSEQEEKKESEAIGDQVIPTNGDKSEILAGDHEEAELCDLHFIANCQSCSNWISEEEKDEDNGEGWMSHILSFEKDRLGKDLEWKRKNEEELVVVDPLEKAREFGVEKVAKSEHKQSKREWDMERDSKSRKNRS